MTFQEVLDLIDECRESERLSQKRRIGQATFLVNEDGKMKARDHLMKYWKDEIGSVERTAKDSVDYMLKSEAAYGIKKEKGFSSITEKLTEAENEARRLVACGRMDHEEYEEVREYFDSLKEAVA